MYRWAFLLIVTLAVLASCMPPTSVDELQLAQTELVAYYAALANGEYDIAADMMADNPDFWEMARGSNLDVDPEDKPALLQAVCDRLCLCMPVHDVVQAEQIEEGVYGFTVRFALEEAVFVLGPCCGADETEMPPGSEFNYQVYKVDGGFKVDAEPVYVP